MDLACEFGRYRVRAVCAYTVTVSALQINKSLSLNESCPPFYTLSKLSNLHTTWSSTFWPNFLISGIIKIIYVVLSWKQEQINIKDCKNCHTTC